jgi:hypothetical protein
MAGAGIGARGCPPTSAPGGKKGVLAAEKGRLIGFEFVLRRHLAEDLLDPGAGGKLCRTFFSCLAGDSPPRRSEEVRSSIGEAFPRVGRHGENDVAEPSAPTGPRRPSGSNL